MKEEMRTFGYLCPVCHKSVIAGRSTFALSASGAVISCECGKSSLSVDSDGRRFRLSVPCGLCGEEHTAECDSEQLLRGEGIGLACPQTKALCCFIGEDYAVEREMEQLSLTAAKQREQGEGEDVFLDNVIMYEVLSELREIAARPHGITCAGTPRLRANRLERREKRHSASQHRRRLPQPHLHVESRHRQEPRRMPRPGHSSLPLRLLHVKNEITLGAKLRRCVRRVLRLAQNLAPHTLGVLYLCRVEAHCATTRSASETVVTPSRHFARASSASVRIPFLRAIAKRSLACVPAAIAAAHSASGAKSSNTPTLPL